MTGQTLKPYTGPHAGNLHHVMRGDQVERPATPLEVRLYQEVENARQELRHLRTAMNHIAHITGTHGQDHNATIKAVAGLVASNKRET